ncbi:DUF427 domain-containing protein [Marisediminicola sp. LYQ134]|uniref:DUF427 domain-containing protein n=1 Tax=unclassified Marisediminicola TaxID=2618316 RepID=UPI00398337D4
MRRERIVRTEPGPGQESVWDYPRPPRVEAVDDRVTITLGGVLVADTTRAQRVLETSHPPVFYIPEDDFAAGSLEPAPGSSWCEFKGRARYLSVRGGDVVAESAAWTYPTPTPAFTSLAGTIAVYPGRMDRCTVGDETVTAQDGDFYGGWITSTVVGPFKGAPGTLGW